MLAVDVDYGLSLLRGMVATVNPCGFVLLPTYLVYFLGVEAAGAEAGTGGGQRATVRRALLVGTAVSAGFMVVFVTIGLITGAVHTWLIDQAKYITLVLGVGFVVLGTAILAGYRPRFATPHLDVGLKDRNVATMFLYGMAYAIASLGCTIAIFLPVIARPGLGFVGTAWNVAAYALGMSLVVIALTVSLAVANQVLVRWMRKVMRHLDLLAAALMLLSGLYLIWYFFVVDLNGETDGVVAAVQDWQERVVVRLDGNWQVAALILGGIVVAAVVFVLLGRHHRRRPDGSLRPDQPERADPSPKNWAD